MVGMRWSCDKRQGFSVKKQLLLLGIQWCCLAWRSRVFFPPRKFKDNGATATAHEYLTYHLGPRQSLLLLCAKVRKLESKGNLQD
ncbi:hypothetical protein H9L39_09149 [Fusarium oxysporum f. sp. albedinis]|nr:hypothetical protein H9L39_09149 [Fusarium oxysporum f. sp. albedinis]